MTKGYASLYARLTRASTDSNTSLAGWIEDMRELCAREGLKEVALHVDDGKSGGKRDRDEFHAWLADARTGLATVLMTPEVDRLTREGLNVAASILDVIEGKDPTTGQPSHRPVRMLDTKGLDSEHGDAFRLRFVIQAEIGRSERERIRTRTRDRTRRIVRAGRWRGGLVPYGYQPAKIKYVDSEGKDRAGYVLEQEPAEAEVLQEAMSRVLSDQALTRICRWLNESGYAPHRAKQFTAVSLRRILTAGPPQGLSGESEPVFSPAETAALRVKLATVPGQRPAGGRHPTRLLSTLLECSGCGGQLAVSRHASKPIYTCRSRAIGKLCPHMVSVVCEPVEAYVTKRVMKLLGDKPMTRQETFVEGLDDLASVDEEISDVMASLAENATMESLSRLQALQSTKAELLSKPREPVTRIVDTGMTGREWWEKATLDDRRDLIADIWPSIVLLPGIARKGFVPERLDMRHGEPDHEYEAWLQREG